MLLLSQALQAQGLDSYINTGLQNSPLLKEYQARLQSNTLDSSILNAQRKPLVSASSQIMAAPVYNGWGYDAAVTNTGNYAAQVGVTQNLLTKKIYAPQYNALNIEKQDILISSRISEHDLKKSITDQYLAAYTSYTQLTFIRSAYELMNSEDTLLRKFVEQGIYKQADYLAFTIAVQSQKLQMRELQFQYRSDLRQLNFICGMHDTAYPILSEPQIQANALIEKTSSPVIMRFKIDSLRLTNQKALVDINYRPRLNWFADAGLLGYSPALLYKNFGASFGLNFSVPLYDGKQKQLQYQKISISESTRTNYKSFYLTQYDLHISQVKAELSENEQMISEIRKQLTTSENLIKMSKQLLNHGEMPVTDFIITIKNYIDVKSQLNRSEFKRLQLISELNYWNW